ncbi:MAG: AAA family ATPase [Alphaproteobacteria bacterium]|nr:AAA family ATPase [Alphaproteobacteria bacterium]
MIAEPRTYNGAPLRKCTHVSGRDFLTLLRFVMRHKWLPFAGMALGFGAGLAALALMPPLYSASTRVMVERDALRTEAQIVESTPVFEKVAGTLGLYRDPRFAKESVFEKIMQSGDEENALRERVIGRLEKIVSVRALEGTGILDITVRFSNPERAAQIANVVLSAYRERKMDERFEQSREISAWMGKHLESVRKQADDAQKRLQDYQIKYGIATDSDTGARGQIQILQSQIEAGEVAIAALKAKLAGMPEPQAKAVSPALKTEEAAIKKQIQIQGQRYGDKHPKMIALNAALQSVRAKLSRKTMDPRKAISAEIADTEDKLGRMRTELEAISKSASEGSKVQYELTALQSEAAANMRLYENMLVKYQNVVADADLQDQGLKIVSMATIPSSPDQQNRLSLLLGLGITGFLIGALVVFIRAFFNTGFTNAAQLEGMTGYPVFAAVPDAAMKGVAIHHTVIEKPAAILAESLRSLRVALRLRSDNTIRGPRVVSVTSTLPNEGKTSLAVMLAMIAAKSGERVCIVDCDLRRPSLHKAFGIGNARGLQDYLNGDSSVEDVIYRRDSSGVHMITAKAAPTYSLTLLTSGRMELLIQDLRDRYDFIVLDAPSSLAFADARVLAKMVDQTMYVVSWNRTRREGVLTSLKAYADMGYENLALVLNKVDLREYLRESASAVVYQYGHEETPLAAT